ncbi:hypothetical protein [Emticicia sp.]|uniref:hypothetical protein n=1 Tax=Emticicia sp. TaxID=1930953 RepID=UPI0037522272
MKNKNNTDLLKKQIEKEEIINFPGYPLYPASEDIYSKFRKDVLIDPEDVSKIKETVDNGKVRTRNEKDFDDSLGDDLDVPGSELDDAQEDIGSEDEENNYYSIGGDNHNDLEEEKGE